MKILALSSSPRSHSNSRLLLETILENIPKDSGHVIRRLDVAKLNIKPCTACKACFRNETASCVLEDDYAIVADAIAEAEYIFMASPVYWWYISAQLKLVIDRSYPPPYEKFKNKTIFLVTTGAEPVDSVQHEIITKSFQEICGYMGCHFRYFAAQADDREYPITKNLEALKQARELGETFDLQFAPAPETR